MWRNRRHKAQERVVPVKLAEGDDGAHRRGSRRGQASPKPDHHPSALSLLRPPPERGGGSAGRCSSGRSGHGPPPTQRGLPCGLGLAAIIVNLAGKSTELRPGELRSLSSEARAAGRYSGWIFFRCRAKPPAGVLSLVGVFGYEPLGGWLKLVDINSDYFKTPSRRPAVRASDSTPFLSWLTAVAGRQR